MWIASTPCPVITHQYLLLCSVHVLILTRLCLLAFVVVLGGWCYSRLLTSSYYCFCYMPPMAIPGVLKRFVRKVIMLSGYIAINRFTAL